MVKTPVAISVRPNRIRGRLNGFHPCSSPHNPKPSTSISEMEISTMTPIANQNRLHQRQHKASCFQQTGYALHIEHITHNLRNFERGIHQQNAHNPRQKANQNRQDAECPDRRTHHCKRPLQNGQRIRSPRRPQPAQTNQLRYFPARKVTLSAELATKLLMVRMAIKMVIRKPSVHSTTFLMERVMPPI